MGVFYIHLKTSFIIRWTSGGAKLPQVVRDLFAQHVSNLINS